MGLLRAPGATATASMATDARHHGHGSAGMRMAARRVDAATLVRQAKDALRARRPSDSAGLTRMVDARAQGDAW